MRSPILTLTALAVLLFTAALTSAQPTDPLTGSTWVLVALPDDAAPQAEITLTFDAENRVGGNGGCNSYGGNYTLDGDTLTFSALFSTMMACAEPSMAQELAYLSALESTQTYTLTRDTLTLTDARGQTLVFERQRTLIDATWVLLSLDGEPLALNSEITLTFDADNGVSGNSGCNSYGGGYTLEGDTLTFGALFSTLMACMDESLMEQEQAYLRTLEAVTGYTLQNHTLTLSTSEGQTLVFEAQPTLKNSAWALSTLDGAQPLADSEITLMFDAQNSISGHGSCNRYGGTYTREGENITFSQVFSTRMACEGTLAQEQTYLELLNAVTQYTLIDDTLTLSTDDGATLVFTRMAPPQP